MTPLPVIIGIIIFIFALFVILKIARAEVEGRLLFKPIKEHLDSIEVPPYTEITLPSGIKAWYFDNHENSPTILYCHGNAANRSYWDRNINAFDSQKLNIFIFDYHGFSDSPGVTSIESMIADAEESYWWLRQRVAPEDILLLGESLGGSAALHIIKKHKHCARNLILAGTFSRPDNVIREKGLPRIYELLAKSREELDNLTLISEVDIPIIIIHSSEDNIIPYACAMELYLKIKHKCKRLVTIKGSHSAPKFTTAQLEEILAFCNVSCDNICTAEPHLELLARDDRNIFKLPG